MGRKAIILGKKVVSRTETLKYASERFGWKNVAIGISCFFGFWAWVIGRLTGRKVIYYCIDFYSPKVSINSKGWRRLFCFFAMLMDKFLVKHCDECWDISDRINHGRGTFGNYHAELSKIVPLSYPPSYFRFRENVWRNKVAFVGLDPYGLELAKDIPGIELEWLGGKPLIPLDELLDKLSLCGIGLSMWEEDGNNYYGDPGKTKLYSACGLPVIMTPNTPYARIINLTQAGIVIRYNRDSLEKAVKLMLNNYSYYKDNVPKTWRYINADIVCGSIGSW